MHATDLVSPISSTDRDKVELGRNEGTLDGNLHFLGDLDSETDVTVHISDNNNSFEAGSLSGLSLLLDGDDLHDLIVKFGVLILEEFVDNTGFLDGDGVSVDFFEGGDVTVLDESSEFGGWCPFILGGTTGSSTISAGTSTASSSEASATFTAAVCSTFTIALFSAGCFS